MFISKDPCPDDCRLMQKQLSGFIFKYKAHGIMTSITNEYFKQTNKELFKLGSYRLESTIYCPNPNNTY